MATKGEEHPDSRRTRRRLAPAHPMALVLALAVGGCAHARPLAATSPSAVDGGDEELSLALAPGVSFAIADRARGVALLTERDAVIAGMSAIDRQVRLGSSEPVDEAALLARIAGEIRTFDEDEVRAVRRALVPIRAELAALGATLPFPATIDLVKTTGREETGSDVELAYTRGHAIVLNEAVFASDLGYYLRHELFHLITRANPALRDALYAVIGYRHVAPIALPPALEARRVTNPDAPAIEHVVRVLHHDGPIDVANVLLARVPYRGEPLLDVLEAWLVEIDEHGQVLIDEGGAPRLHAIRDVPGYLDRVGYNTRYVFQPEEILADAFVLLLRGERAPSPWVIEGMRSAFGATPR